MTFTAVQQTFAAGTPSLLRAINERTVLECIRQVGPASRAQIARASGVSKPTVSQALSVLEKARLVREAGRTSGGKGPTALLYELNPSAGHVVGIDVGRERVRAAVADLAGAVAARVDEPTRLSSAKALIGQLGRVARGVADDAGLRWPDITVACIGSPGVFGEAGDHATLAHNLPGWSRTGVLDAVRAELGTHVLFDNDVNLAALGERRLGLGRDVEQFIYLHVGTGVGMGIVIDGQVYRGASGAAGEVGYLPLATTDPHDPANRRRGSLESAIGATAVVRAARDAGFRRTGLTAANVLESARAGDPRGLAVVAELGARIGLALAAIVPVLDPALVILGGGIGRNGDILLDAVRRELAALSPIQPPVVVSQLGEDAELLGALAMALGVAQDRLFARAEMKGEIAV
ncbi:MAG: ROK family transcriptional regulator [Actinomycetota bacterium]